MIETGAFQGVVLRAFGLPIAGSVGITWLLMIVLAAISWGTTRTLRPEPGSLQTVLEGIVSVIEDSVEDILPGKSDLVLPFIGTLWIFIMCANLTGLVPGLSSPTADLSVTAALAAMVFLSVHWFGVASEGWRGYLRHYVSPSPVLLPFHLISEFSRTIALAVRLFGNMMSLDIAAALVLTVAGPLIPVPILMLHIVEAVIQAYLFGVLALIYIAGGVQTAELRRRREGGGA